MATSRLWFGVSVALMGLVSPALALAEPAEAPESVLKDKGLRRSGSVYAIAGEAEFQKKLNAAKVIYRSIATAAARKQQFEAGIAAGRNEMLEMERQLVFLNQQLSQVTNAEEHNRLVAMNNALVGQLNIMRKQEASADVQQVPGARLAILRQEFVEAVLELRQLADKTNETYAELAKDDAVKTALAALNETSKIKVTLGPSKTFLSNVSQLKKVEGTVLTETVELRKEGGVHWVDVTFNGKTTRSMVFDTGASSVVLPADLAAEIGLKPGPNDPTVKAQVADGSIVVARQMVIPSVRLGKFTIKDVECIVMPSAKENVAPLLGQTFQRYFIIKFTPDTGQLELKKVDTPEPEAPVAKTKGSTRTARGTR